MTIYERLKRWGDIEIPLSAVAVIVAITIITLYQPQKEVYYIPVNGISQQKQGL